MQPSPQPVVFPEQVEYISREDLVVGTNVKIATVARKISKLGNFMEAEVSLSPTIVIPFINDKGYYRVRTLLDPGSGTNWIVASLLRNMTHTVKGSEVLEVATFSGVIRKNYPLVEVLYPLPNGKTAKLKCYVTSNFTKHVAVQGMVSYIRKNTNLDEGILGKLADPASQEVDHGRISQGVGLILCSSSINKIRTQKSVITLHKLGIHLEPTIFGVAISGAIAAHLSSPDNIVMANNIALSSVISHQDLKPFLAKDEVILPVGVNFMCEQQNLDLQPKEHHVDHSLFGQSPTSSIRRAEVLGQHTAEIPWNNDHILRVAESVDAVGFKKQKVIKPEHLKVIPQVEKDLESKDCMKEMDTNIPIVNFAHLMPHRGIIERFDTAKCQLMVDTCLKPSASHISFEQVFYQSFVLLVGFTTLLLRYILCNFVSISSLVRTFLRILIAPGSVFWSNNSHIPQGKPKTHKFKYQDKSQYLIKLNNYKKAKKYCREIADRKRLKNIIFEGFETSKPPDRAKMALEVLNSLIKVRKETEISASLSLDN